MGSARATPSSVGAHKCSSAALAVSSRDGKGEKSKARMLAAQAHTLYQHARQGPQIGTPMVSEPTTPTPGTSQPTMPLISFPGRPHKPIHISMRRPHHRPGMWGSRHKQRVTQDPSRGRGCADRLAASSTAVTQLRQQSPCLSTGPNQHCTRQ